MPFNSKFEFILQFEKILGDMKKKSPETYQRTLQFLGAEKLETILPVLQKFFPTDRALIETLERKDIDLMLMRIMRSEIAHLQGEGERLVARARAVVQQFGFFPPVNFLFDFNGAELYEAMVERIYHDLRRGGKPRELSEVWKRLSAPFSASSDVKAKFPKDLLFKIRQRLKNHLLKDRRFLVDALSPKKLVLRLVEWDSQEFQET